MQAAHALFRRMKSVVQSMAPGLDTVRPAPWYTTDTALLSDKGPVRPDNEDSVLSLSRALEGLATERTWVVALADGMGGHQAGETASRVAVETVVEVHRQPSGESTVQRLVRALEQANAAVFSLGESDPALEGMGTTLVVLVLTEEASYCAWVGDSRLYRWRADRIEPLSRDDTLVRELLDEGLIQPNDVPHHPDRSVLSQALGTRPQLRRTNLVGPIDLAAGDRFLLCSDGLHDVVPESVLVRLLAHGRAADIVQALFRSAVEHGADDNISAAVVCIEALEARPRTPRPTVITTLTASAP